MNLKVIITGSTGMVGEGVLLVCLDSADVESVLVINRKPCGIEHPKLEEIIHKDFMNLSPIENQLVGYNACFFCAGVSSIGKKEDEYRKITYDLTMNFAQALIKVHASTPLSMNSSNNSENNLSRAESRDDLVNLTFCYVSGSGTDGTESSRFAWARIKGKTENDLLKLGFKDAYMFRPAYIEPYVGQKYAYKIYKFTSPIYPLLLKLFPNYFGSMKELGNSMINVTLSGFEKKVLEVVDIRNSNK